MKFDSIKESSGKSLTEQIAVKISQMIVDKHLTAGEKLPNEFELASYLQVGRGTVREAIKLLISSNVLEIRRGKGTFVVNHPGVVKDPWGFAFIDDKYQLARDLLELRFIVEPSVAELAAEKATLENIETLKNLCNEVEDMIRQGIPHSERDMEFHKCIANCTQNQMIPNLIPIISYSISTFIEVTNSSLSEETIETHRMIVEGIEQHDPQKAKDGMIKHLTYNRERMTTIFHEVKHITSDSQ